VYHVATFSDMCGQHSEEENGTGLVTLPKIHMHELFFYNC